jgi:hypothetical protein
VDEEEERPTARGALLERRQRLGVDGLAPLGGFSQLYERASSKPRLNQRPRLSTAAVKTPRLASSSASVGRPAGSAAPACETTPCPKTSRPVWSVVKAGWVGMCGETQSRKSVPLAASRSRCGLVGRG